MEGHLWKHNSRWKSHQVLKTHQGLEDQHRLTWNLFKIIWHPFTKLGDEIATLARHLTTDTIPHDHASILLACRLVPLKKEDIGTRPVSVSECLRRIIGKTITGLLKADTCTVGILHTCMGLESGIEAAIHAVKKSYEEENSECLLLVDADNTFNKLNRNVSLENIKRLCPPCTHTYTTATTHPPCFTWKMRTRYYHRRVWRKETMQLWQSMSHRQPLVQALSNESANDEEKQIWYADDSFAVGSMAGVKKWWE